VVVGKTYDFLLWLLPKVETFPPSYRFSVGEGVVKLRIGLAADSGGVHVYRPSQTLLPPQLSRHAPGLPAPNQIVAPAPLLLAEIVPSARARLR